MSRSFDLAVAFMQLFMLVMWEALGTLYFGWSPFAIFYVWLVGLWSLNIGVATILRTYIKLTRPSVEVDINAAPDISLEDIGG